MKYRKYALVMLTFLLIFLTGCQDKGQDIEQPQPEVKSEVTLIEPVTGDSLETGIMTKLREFSCDVDMDNEDESIELYTAAGRAENGDMQWDDGQSWILLVRDGEKAYPLLSRYVQLGVVHFTVSNSNEDKLPYITVIVPTNASFSMKGYTYNKEKDSFSEETLYESEDDNWLYSTIPGY
ncbi:MAG TPA: hypothetical protein VEG39_12770 [Clostridia bacterium]|nr:hypothetical protein [Clostridia bacterium]